MKWYLASDATIRPIEVISETVKTVTLEGGLRQAKDTEWQWYRPTWDEARAALIANCKSACAQAKIKLEYREERLKKVLSLTEGGSQ